MALPIEQSFRPGPAPPETQSDPSPAFREFESAMAPAVEADRRQAEERYATTVETINQAITRTAGLTNPVAPMNVPEPPNPILAGLSGFFAHLNQAQGGGGAAPAALFNTLSGLNAQRQEATQQNAQSERAFSLSKFGTTEDLHGKLLTAMRDKSAEIGNLEKTFQHNKALYALERQKAKEALNAKTAAQEQGQRNAIDRIKLRGQIQATNARSILKLRQEVENRAMTPAQRAQFTLVNTKAAELRAQVDDMRGARDLAGDPVYSAEEIDSRETQINSQLEGMYTQLITDFQTPTEKQKSPVAPPPGGTVAAPPVGSSRVQAAADRLRGTALFQ